MVKPITTQRRGYVILGRNDEEIGHVERIIGLELLESADDSNPGPLPKLTLIPVDENAARYLKEWNDYAGEVRDLKIQRLSDGHVIEFSRCFYEKSTDNSLTINIENRAQHS